MIFQRQKYHNRTYKHTYLDTMHRLAVLLSLVIGIVGAVAVSAWLPSMKAEAVAIADVVGNVWVNAVRMTVIPLVVCLVISSIAGCASSRAVSRLGIRAVVTFVLLLAFAGVTAAIITTVAIPMMPGDAAPIVQASVPSPPRQQPTDWISALVPPNPFKAAADGAMLPLLVFWVGFAIALLQVRTEGRELVVASCQAVVDAMLVILGWVIRAAPAGVLCLVFSLVATTGLSTVGVLGFYVALLCAALLVVMAFLIAATVIVGGIPLPSLVKTITPALVIAFTSRSSLAALPVLIKSVHQRLEFPSTVIAFVLPFSVSVFRLSVPVSQVVGALFVARLAGIELQTAQLFTIIGLAVLLSFSVPGIPNAAVVSMFPIFEAVGLPVQAVGMLIAVDVVPDAFKTMLNVTGHVAAAAIAAGGQEPQAERVAAEAARTAT